MSKSSHSPTQSFHRALDTGYKKWNEEGWRTVTLKAISKPDAAVTRTAQQSLQSALNYVSALDIGATFAIMTIENDSKSFWLASKQSQVYVADETDVNTGVTKGEKCLSIIWYDRLTEYKYVKLNDVTQVSVSSVCVTVSNIMWQRTTTNRYYLGETTHSKLMELVQKMGEL